MATECGPPTTGLGGIDVNSRALCSNQPYSPHLETAPDASPVTRRSAWTSRSPLGCTTWNHSSTRQSGCTTWNHPSTRPLGCTTWNHPSTRQSGCTTWNHPSTRPLGCTNLNHPSTSTSTAFSRHTSEPWHRLHGPQASTSRPARAIQPCCTQHQHRGTFPSSTGCTVHRQLLPLEFRLRCMRPIRFIEQLDGPAVTTPAGATNRSRLVCAPERLPRSSRALRKVPGR